MGMNTSWIGARRSASARAAPTLGRVAAAGLFFLGAQGASAQTDSAVLEITGEVSPRCWFIQDGLNADLGELQQGVTRVVGALGFRCNLASSGPVQLTIRSQYGALRRDGGAETISYQAAWDVDGRGEDFGDAGNWIAENSFTLPSGAFGVGLNGDYKIKVTGETDTAPAGAYRDTITYTITP